jgi:hypothetical protein
MTAPVPFALDKSFVTSCWAHACGTAGKNFKRELVQFGCIKYGGSAAFGILLWSSNRVHLSGLEGKLKPTAHKWRLRMTLLGGGTWGK